MNKFWNLQRVGILFFLASVTYAHMVPIYPNHLFMHVDNDRLIVEAQVSAPFWILDVLGQKPPPSHWPDNALASTRAYWDSHVVLKCDGQTLSSELTDARFVEEFWDQSGHSQLLLTFHYPLPPNGKDLSGRITLYTEDQKPGLPPEWEWISYVHVQGQKPARLTVPVEQPEWTVPIADLIRTPAQRQWLLLKQGFLFWQSTPAFLLLAGGLLLLIAGRKGIRFSAWAALPIAIALGIATAASRPFHVVPAISASVILMLWQALILAGLVAYQRQLRHHSESRAPILFRSQTHFLGLMATGFGVYLLLKGL